MEKIAKDKAYSEVYSILNLLGKDYIDKLPNDLYKMIKENRNMEYSPLYDLSIDINKQNISEQALAMITLLNLKCWSNEDEKKEIQKEIDKNEKEFQENNEKLYDLSFLNEKKTERIDNCLEEKNLIKQKTNIFVAILNGLRKIFKKKEGK